MINKTLLGEVTSPLKRVWICSSQLRFSRKPFCSSQSTLFPSSHEFKRTSLPLTTKVGHLEEVKLSRWYIWLQLRIGELSIIWVVINTLSLKSNIGSSLSSDPDLKIGLIMPEVHWPGTIPRSKHPLQIMYKSSIAVEFLRTSAWISLKIS
jgi:hypothetical protein